MIAVSGVDKLHLTLVEDRGMIGVGGIRLLIGIPLSFNSLPFVPLNAATLLSTEVEGPLTFPKPPVGAGNPLSFKSVPTPLLYRGTSFMVDERGPIMLPVPGPGNGYNTPFWLKNEELTPLKAISPFPFPSNPKQTLPYVVIEEEV